MASDPGLDHHLRPASVDDRDFLLALNRRVYHDLVVEQFGSWDEQEQRERFLEKLAEGDFRVVEVAGERIGTIWVADETYCLRLREIQISPEFQNRGIGSRLVRDLLERGRVAGRPVRLRVLKNNRAQALYRRLGFRRTGESETQLHMEAGPRKDSAPSRMG